MPTTGQALSTESARPGNDSSKDGHPDRPREDYRSGAGVLVLVFLVVLVGVIGVPVGRIRVGVLVVLILLVRAATQLSLQPVKVHSAAVVLQLAGHLHLLGLGSAAPHWLDPLERPSGPIRPLLAASGFTRTTNRPVAHSTTRGQRVPAFVRV